MNVNKYQNLFIIYDVILIIIISLLLYLSQPIVSSKVVYIPNGSAKKIITYLSNKNFELSIVDLYLVRFFGKPQSGWVDISEERLSRGDFLYKITHSKAATQKIILIPGETKEIFFQEIAAALNLSYKKLIKEYNKRTKQKDGLILAETYHMPIGMSERHIIHYFLSSTDQIYKKLSFKVFGEYDKKKWMRYITIASIIQKEAASNDEMPIVSAVIYNRLKKRMKLQMDGTLNYGKYSHQKITAKRIKTDNSVYNTYKRSGLPPYPVCSVSIKAIKAAIFPAQNDYLYFVKGKSGKHIFSKNYKRHIQNIRR